jgi:hypothetical protein
MAEPNAPAQETPAQDAQQRAQIQIDDTKTTPLYSNFCRVTGTPEEMSAPDVSGQAP